MNAEFGCCEQPMSWSRKFANPTVLKDGRTIARLADASIIVLALPERTQLRPHWQSAGELLIEATMGSI
jgi:hypothetical protein